MIIIIRNKYSSELICYWIIGGGQMELSNGADQQVYSGNWRPKLEEVEELWRGNWKEVQMKGGNQIFLYNNVSCCWMAVGIEKNVYIIVYRYMCVCVRMCFPLSTEIMSKEEPYYIYIYFFFNRLGNSSFIPIRPLIWYKLIDLYGFDLISPAGGRKWNWAGRWRWWGRPPAHLHGAASASSDGSLTGWRNKTPAIMNKYNSITRQRWMDGLGGGGGGGEGREGGGRRPT